MKIETKGNNIIEVELPDGKIFSVGLRGQDHLVVCRVDEYSDLLTSSVAVYVEGKGEEPLGHVRHVVLN